MDFFYKGFACVDLFDPKFATDLWKDVDQDEITRLLTEVSDKPWKPLNLPRPANFAAFIQEIDNNMYKCWERYGKRWLKPKILGQHLNLFMRTQNGIESVNTKEYVWVMIPLITISQHQGLPTLMEGSHLDGKSENKKPIDLVVQHGQALMFDARLKLRDPNAGGGVVFARAYNVMDNQELENLTAC